MDGLEAFSRLAFINHFSNCEGYPVQNWHGAIEVEPEGYLMGPTAEKSFRFLRNVRIYNQRALLLLEQPFMDNVPRDIHLSERQIMTLPPWSLFSWTTKTGSQTVQDWIRHFEETRHPVDDILDAEGDVINAITNNLPSEVLEGAISNLVAAFHKCTKTAPNTIEGKKALVGFLGYESGKLPLLLSKLLDETIDESAKTALSTMRVLVRSEYSHVILSLHGKLQQQSRDLNISLQDPRVVACTTAAFAIPETRTGLQEHLYHSLEQIGKLLSLKYDSESLLDKSWHSAIKQQIAQLAEQLGNYQKGLPFTERFNNPVLKDIYTQLCYYSQYFQELNPDGTKVDSPPYGKSSAICLNRSTWPQYGTSVKQEEIIISDEPDGQGFSDRQIITITREACSGGLTEDRSERYIVRFNEHTREFSLYLQEGENERPLDYFTPKQLKENYISIAAMLVEKVVKTDPVEEVIR